MVNWTGLHLGGPDHLGLWLIGLPSILMALITSGCGQGRRRWWSLASGCPVARHGRCSGRQRRRRRATYTEAPANPLRLSTFSIFSLSSAPCLAAGGCLQCFAASSAVAFACAALPDANRGTGAHFSNPQNHGHDLPKKQVIEIIEIVVNSRLRMSTVVPCPCSVCPQ